MSIIRRNTTNMCQKLLKLFPLSIRLINSGFWAEQCCQLSRTIWSAPESLPIFRNRGLHRCDNYDDSAELTQHFWAKLSIHRVKLGQNKQFVWGRIFLDDDLSLVSDYSDADSEGFIHFFEIWPWTNYSKVYFIITSLPKLSCIYWG